MRKTNDRQPRRPSRAIAANLILSCSLMGLAPAQAGMVSTETVAAQTVHSEASSQARSRVNDFLARDDVRQALMGQGMDLQAAQARVNAMSDVEVAELAGRVDSAPAGGSVLGVIFTIFVILLVTDILGFTKVFPFTRSIR